MKNEDLVGQPSRRDFLRIGAAGALGLGMGELHGETPGEDAPASHAGTMINVPFEKSTPRIGIIGTGGPRHEPARKPAWSGREDHGAMRHRS